MKFMEKLRDTLYAARNAQALLAEPRALRKTRAELMAELTAAELRERQYQRGAPGPAREAPEASRGEDRLPPAAPPRPQREGPGEMPVGRLDLDPPPQGFSVTPYQPPGAGDPGAGNGNVRRYLL